MRTVTRLKYFPQWVVGNAIGTLAIVLLRGGHERAGMRVARWADWVWRGVPPL